MRPLRGAEAALPRHSPTLLSHVALMAGCGLFVVVVFEEMEKAAGLLLAGGFWSGFRGSCFCTSLRIGRRCARLLGAFEEIKLRVDGGCLLRRGRGLRRYDFRGRRRL